jgi:hypothetical protein
MTETRPPQKRMTPEVPFVEDLFAPEAFASEASFCSMGPGVVTLTFTSYRFDNAQQHKVSQTRPSGSVTPTPSGAQTPCLPSLPAPCRR